MSANGDGALEHEFVERWRENAYNCFSSGHKFCREPCPVTQVTRNENHTPTAFHANIVAMEKGVLSIEDVADDYVHCTQCGACELRCPNTLFVGDFYRARTETVKVVRAARALLVDKGLDREGWKLWNRLTDELKNEPVLGVENGQPNGQEHVRDWAEGLDLPVGGETVMFVDCEAAFYRTSIPRATAQVLQKAGVEFGLMNEQWCCGGPAAEMGYVEQSRRFAEHNLADWRSTGTKRIIAIEPHDYIHFTEDYPAYFGDDFEIEVVQIMELLAQLIRDGRLQLEKPINRTVTYHDPCRLNKRKGIYEAPARDPARDPGPDVQGRRPCDAVVVLLGRRRRAPDREARDHGRDQPPPAGAREGPRRRHARERLRVVRAAAGERRARGRHRGARHHRARRRVRRDRGRRKPGGVRRGGGAMTAVTTVDRPVVDELEAIIGEPGSVLTNVSSRANRTRVPAPFPVHRWAEFMPAAVVLPRTAEQVSEIVKLANRHRIPLVPRAGGTGLADGAVPLRGGIVVDVKLMNQIKDIDLVDRTVTVGPGINMMTLNRELKQYGVIYPDDPASYPCSLVGGRIACSGMSLLNARYGHTRDLVISFQIVLPTGEIIEVGDGGGRKLRKSSTGYHLKQLFMGHQGTLGIVTEATLELVPRAEAEFAAFFAYDDYMKAYRAMANVARSGLGTIAGVVLFDEKKIAYLRRDDEAFIPMPPWVVSVMAVALYGAKVEVQAASKRIMELGRTEGGKYTGDEMAAGDWASRHDRYANPLHGRTRDGTVAPMSWHCEDAALNYSVLPQVREEWHALVDEYSERYGIFDDWGMFAYTTGAYKPWGDYLVEIDVGIWEQQLDDANWAGWVELKRKISEVSLKYGGSITSCHGATREGDAELVPQEMGTGWDVMKRIKREFDPNNIMNPGKLMLDEAYVETNGGGPR